MKKLLAIIFSVASTFLYSQEKIPVITSDIGNFWKAYDKISSTTDSVQQYNYLNTLFIAKGTPGLHAFMEARGYTPKSYVDAINSYPLFWQSVRKNTYKASQFGEQINKELLKLKKLYPEMKPAPVYFTVGAMRSGGSAGKGMVLIGSEMALADENTVSDEFPETMAQGRRVYFDSNPINDVVLLNIHEYVHTQQKPIVHNLLSYVIYEGVAEFVSVKATGKPSAAPAVQFGKKNPDVKRKFEQEVFNFRATDKWLWSDVQNEFNVRDLGYYIGYALCEKYYEAAKDKQLAIKKMIQLDYTNEPEIEEFVNSTKFFSGTIAQLYDRYEASRPVVAGVKGLTNGSTTVKPGLTKLTISFSTVMDKNYRNFDYGPLGEDAVLGIRNVVGFSEDGRSITVEVQLDPEKHYQLTVSNGFRDLKGTPLKPYLIDITTSK
jgi:hypothetical protein